MEDSDNNNFVLNKLTAWSLDEYAENFESNYVKMLTTISLVSMFINSK